jgi:ParB family chromosome partitioning protein
MYIPIKKIIVRDRIRKDFGDIGELARDIQDNGLINPPVVNKEYVLLAGERRLRACKQLGWEQIPVTMMDTRDAEHELNIEISENDVRKGFSKAERVDYMYRLMRIEKEKAKERMSEGGKGAVKSSDVGEAKDKTAVAFGIGRQTMEREMQIVENKDLLTPEDFADWDEGRLSTNKAYQRIKAELDKARREKDMAEGFAATVKAQAKREAREEVKAELESLRQTNRTLKAQAESTSTVLEPEDYQGVKNSLEHAEDTIEQREAEIANLKQQLRDAANKGTNDFSATLYEYALDDMVQFINRYSELEEIAPVIEAMKEVMA